MSVRRRPISSEPRFFERGGQLLRWRHAERPGLAAAEAGVYLRGEVRPGREHDARGEEGLSRRDFDAARLAVLDYELRRLALVEVEIFLRQERGAVVVAVAPRAALSAQRAHRRALRCVEPAQVLRRVVGSRGALAAERVYLAHDVALRGAAYRRIAGHHRYAVDVYAEQQRPRAHPGGRERRFAARVARADDYNVVIFAYFHLFLTSLYFFFNFIYFSRAYPVDRAWHCWRNRLRRRREYLSAARVERRKELLLPRRVELCGDLVQ